MNRVGIIALLGIAAAGCSAPETEVDTGEDTEIVEGETVVERTPTKNAYFGDLHVHTRNSFDAYIFATRRTPDDAYRFAKGEVIPHDAGYEIQLDGPPLDFLAVTDHGEYLGVIPFMDDPNHPLSKTMTAQAAFGDDAAASAETFQNIGISFVIGQPIEEIRDQEHMNQIWAQTINAAERHNDPGTFTTFAGYEFTAMTIVSQEAGAAANLHRNVIFRDAAPDQVFSTLDSTNPEDLWAWMDGQREAGIDVLAIPHNSNSSNGEMFALQTYDGAPLTEDYAVTRLRNEPIVEMTQIKGTSETHPSLSPNDEWANFEQYDYFIGSSAKSTVNEGDFVRPSLARGLALAESLGANPYEFGFIGSSDTHIAAATLREDTHWGKFPTDGANPQSRSSVPPEGYTDWADVPNATDRRILTGAKFSASGLVGVWAESNTRDDLFDGMRNRETFGTSGPRMKVRLFAGDYDASILDAADLLDQAYVNGVPMGGNLVTSEGEAPSLLAWAVQDPLSAPLQRLQVIKVWAEDGAAREAVYDVACSDGSTPDPQTHRCADNGASVDISTCATEPGTGSGELKAVWQDPSYDPDQVSAYYVRVLENPTCRWSTWDAVRAGTPPNPNLPTTLQERAWSSPIWVD
ncbi:MAG: DUF3604 domain-containing protein [Hyphomonadaceae bacterium]|nr:DUF3604 domain-containing protein [Hyphomonadaceae bacterium]